MLKRIKKAIEDMIYGLDFSSEEDMIFKILGVLFVSIIIVIIIML